MANIKQILTELTNHLETIATNLGAMEAALTTQGTLSSHDIDTHSGVMGQSHRNAKHALVNVRHAISQLPD